MTRIVTVELFGADEAMAPADVQTLQFSHDGGVRFLNRQDGAAT